MKRTKIICPECGQEISRSNFSKHERRHKNNPKTFDTRYKLTHEGLACQFCGQTCKNRNSLCNHERLCKQNSNRQRSSFVNYNKLIQLGKRQVWNKGLTKENDDRIKLAGIKIAETGKQRYLAGTPINGLHVGKIGYYKGIKCDSRYELAFVIYCLDHNINIKRCNLTYKYQYNGSTHYYYPDFIINNTIIEIKGWVQQPDRQQAKEASVFDKKLLVLYQKDLNEVFKYVEFKYNKKINKDLELLYDS